MTKNHVIGKGGKLPWHIKDEIAHFRKIIRGKTIVMGRKTFDTMKHPLNRGHDIVVTNDSVKTKVADVCGNVEEALSTAMRYGKDVYIIGGQSLFEQTLGIADELRVSYIKKDYEGDRFFPRINAGEWRIVERKRFKEFDYVIYERRESL